jgi:hypothetical protein
MNEHDEAATDVKLDEENLDASESLQLLHDQSIRQLTAKE